MNKLLAFLILMVILVTAIVAVTKPEIKKPISFRKDEIQIIDLSEETYSEKDLIEDNSVNKTEEQNEDVLPQKEEPKQIVEEPKPVKQEIEKPKPQPQREQKQQKQKNNEKPPQPQPQPQPQRPPIPTPNEAVLPKDINAPIAEKTPEQIAEEKELLSWNEWRSKLFNRIIKDANLDSVPNGTVFSIKFNVDRFGKITNLEIATSDPAYAQLSDTILRNTIIGYQGYPILNFPPNTKRTITQFSGKFRKSNVEVLSKPSDFSDYEEIRR